MLCRTTGCARCSASTTGSIRDVGAVRGAEGRVLRPARALMADLKRQLGLLDSTMINVGTIIASAIFIVPSVIALNLGASLPTILVWVVGGAVSLLGALSAAELGAAMPNAGGIYVYLSRAY